MALAKSKLPHWKIALQDGTLLTLQGRIDRIEQAKADGKHYLRIIDFKTGTQGLNLADIYYGLKIFNCLPIYKWRCNIMRS